MKILLNGSQKDLPSPMSIQDLLHHLTLSPTQVIIEHNNTLLPPQNIPTTQLQENDTVEIIHFIGGGH